MDLKQGHLGADADGGANHLVSSSLLGGHLQGAEVARWAGWTGEISGTQHHSKGRQHCL